MAPILQNIREKPFKIYGLSYDENEKLYIRLPISVTDSLAEGTSGNKVHTYLNKQTSGGRVRFMTDSKTIYFEAVQPKDGNASHFTIVGQTGFDIYRGKIGETLHFYDMLSPEGIETTGFKKEITTDGEMMVYQINFPPYYSVSDVLIGVDEGAKLLEAPEYRNDKPVVFYGSSITQGGCASRPGLIYENLLSIKYNFDYVSLGFSGNARGEATMRDYIASLDMSAFVLDYDYNCTSPEHLEETHKPLFDAVRKAHPNLPIIIMTAPTADWTDLMRGYDARFKTIKDLFDYRRAIIKKTYDLAIESGDQNVYFVSCGEAFDVPHTNVLRVDGCHPSDYGFVSMARGMAPAIEEIIKKGQL